jgi:hypothetical protein
MRIRVSGAKNEMNNKYRSRLFHLCLCDRNPPQLILIYLSCFVTRKYPFRVLIDITPSPLIESFLIFLSGI